MRVVCAWCQREGRPGFLGDKPPLDDPTETHGVCRVHRRRALEAVPSRSFPGVRLLVVVGTRDERLYDYLCRDCAGLREIAIIVERRRRDRRRARLRVSDERRRQERRQRLVGSYALGCKYIRFGRTEPGAA